MAADNLSLDIVLVANKLIDTSESHSNTGKQVTSLEVPWVQPDNGRATMAANNRGDDGDGGKSSGVAHFGRM